MSEIWEFIPGYEGIYMVSNFGRIKSCARVKKWGNGSRYCSELIMSTTRDYKGYEVVVLRNSKKKTIKVHRAVAIAFLPNPYSKPHVNHVDGNKLNNNFNNLEWATAKENNIHAYNLNLRKQKSGKQSKLSKPFYAIMQNGIKKLYHTQRECSMDLRIDQSVISRVLNGKKKDFNGIKFITNG